MRSFILLFLVLFGLAFGALFVWKNQTGTDYVLSQYQKIAPFSPREMTYHSASKTLTGKGIVFYRPQFPRLPLRFKADQLQMEATPLEIRLHFSNLVIDMAQTLTLRDGMDLVDTLKSFSPPDSFVTQPLETFVLLNRDMFKGTMDLVIKPEGKQTHLIVTLYQKGKEVFRFATVVHHPAGKGLWHWTTGTFQFAQLTISDQALTRAVMDYYRATQRPIPSDLIQASETGNPFETIIRLKAPMPVWGLLKRF
ncbi:MAG: hypothetical protein IKS41_02915 [Alphaproteobacteria bacterium]|nr:hypothetical protein [Alphaproteobacteria bacterium]